jgi:hypothetical protein
MPTEMGEYLVGAYLKLVRECGVVDYNARPPGGGLQGLGELDVIGFDFLNRRAYLCEVTTHLDGLLIGKGSTATISKIADKHRRQRAYAAQFLGEFSHAFMFWSPVVRRGLAIELQKVEGLELFINGDYTKAVDQLRQIARSQTWDANNPAFRVLQILGHLRNSPAD